MVNRVRKAETRGLIWIVEWQWKKCSIDCYSEIRRIVPRSFCATGRLLINARSAGTCFDIYFGRYKNLLQRSTKSIPISSLLPPSLPFKRLQFTALPLTQHIEFYHLQALITILASSYFPISWHYIKAFWYIILIANHYLNCVRCSLVIHVWALNLFWIKFNFYYYFLLIFRPNYIKKVNKHRKFRFFKMKNRKNKMKGTIQEMRHIIWWYSSIYHFFDTWLKRLRF